MAGGEKTCATCSKPLGLRNVTGYCRVCGPKARDPNHGERVSAGIRRRLAHDPEFRESLTRRALALTEDRAVVARRTAHFDQRIRDMGQVASRSPEARAKAARARTETQLAWCPPELRDQYRHLNKSVGIPAAEAKRVILDQHERDMARFRRSLLVASA